MKPDDEGYFFIYRDGDIFADVLHWLRTKSLLVMYP